MDTHIARHLRAMWRAWKPSTSEPRSLLRRSSGSPFVPLTDAEFIADEKGERVELVTNDWTNRGVYKPLERRQKGDRP